MFDNDQVYYRQRADVELRRACDATIPQVKRVHSELAEAYLGKLASFVAAPGTTT